MIWFISLYFVVGTMLSLAYVYFNGNEEGDGPHLFLIVLIWPILAIALCISLMFDTVEKRGRKRRMEKKAHDEEIKRIQREMEEQAYQPSLKGGLQ